MPIGSSHSNIWYNIYGCDEHYRGATALYLFSILFQSFNIIIYRGISATGHGIEVVCGLDATYKGFIFHLMYTFQLAGIKRFDAQIAVHIATQILT